MNPDPESRRVELYALLGDLPERARPLRVDKRGEEERKNCIVERLLLDLNGTETVPACFTRPKTSGPDPFPAILYNHSHSGDYLRGKEEFLAGGDNLQQPPYCEAFAQRGWAGLCIDHWLFGERHTGETESELFKRTLWSGQVLWGKMVYDTLRAVDYLVSRPDVDGSRLATLGFSMGSTMAWWAAALDTRLKVCVDMCGLTDYHALLDRRGLDLHGLYYYVPGLLRNFTTARINELIAPRPHLGLAGDLDDLTPAEGLDRIDNELRAVYAEAKAPGAWRLMRQNVGHGETLEMRREILAFLDRWL
jgi:dienelactone hydrolase